MKRQYIVVALVSGVLLASGYFLTPSIMKYVKNRAAPAESSGPQGVSLVNTLPPNALEILKEGKADPGELARLLRIYVGKKLPESEDLIRKYLNSGDMRIWAVALSAAGAYPWAPLSDYKQALALDDQQIHISALLGMGRSSVPGRLELVLEFLNRPNLPLQSWVAAKTAQYRLTNDPAAKKKIELELMAKSKEVDETSRAQIFANMAFTVGLSQDLLTEAKNYLEREGEDNSCAYLYQYVWQHDPSWLKERLATLPVRNNYGFVSAVVYSFKVICPEGLAELYQRYTSAIPGFSPHRSDLSVELIQAECLKKSAAK
jgi:hypothetical protein